MKSVRTALSLLAAALSVTAAAAADPLVPMHSLTPAVERTLAAEVRTARAAHPDAFRRVQHLRGLDPAVYNTTRIQRPSVSRELIAMGPDALLPMLDTLLLSGYPTSLDAAQRSALEIGLIEAISALRDRRAEPALRAAFTGLSSSESVRAAARGLGALCTDADVSFLAAEGQSNSPRRDAALEGIGTCRRAPAVRALIDALDHSADERAVVAAAHGLASAGSSWAQRARPGGDDLSAMAATALVRAYGRYRGDTREALRYAILAVGYAETGRLVRDALDHTSDVAVRESLTSLEPTLRAGGLSR